ncbi:glycosyltransferase family 2 protein [bacterium]|nr:glycosyltransferase family 2 protein [bacterium]
MSLSIVIPLYNEMESLPELHSQITQVCEKNNIPFEVIYVDDGSTDDSFRILEAIHQRDSRTKVIQFRKNFGKSEALSAGFSVAKGNMIVTMDADLQDDPAEIPRLIAKLNEGGDLISGWKRKRRDPLTKKIPSRLFNRITSFMTGIRIHDFNCGLKIYRREVIDSIQMKVYGELHRFLPVIAHQNGFIVKELPVTHHPRKYGKSKFGLGRFARGAFDFLTINFLTRYQNRPLHLFGIVGSLFFIAGFIISAILTYEKWVLDKDLSNRPLLFLGVLLIIVGMQSISIGLLGEMITALRNENDQSHIKRHLK